MSATRLATRYAKSLIDLAVEKQIIEEVNQDIETLNAATDNSRDFYLMLKSPIIDADKKKKVIEKAFSGRISKMTENFLDILIRKGREGYLPDIIDDFIKQYNKKKGITPVSITTAQPISEELQNKIINDLKQSAGLEIIELTTKTDESLIGGYILKYDDKMIDTSVARGLSILKDEFDNNEYIRKF